VFIQFCALKLTIKKNVLSNKEKKGDRYPIRAKGRALS